MCLISLAYVHLVWHVAQECKAILGVEVFTIKPKVQVSYKEIGKGVANTRNNVSERRERNIID